MLRRLKSDRDGEENVARAYFDALRLGDDAFTS